MLAKSLVFLSFLAVIVSKSAEKFWLCEIGPTPCDKDSKDGSVHIDGIGKLFSPKVICMDVNKQKSNNDVSNVWQVGDPLSLVTVCSNPSTPCIAAFQICIEDKNLPPVTMECQYLKDFKPLTKCSSSDCPKCGERGAKDQAHLLDAAHGPALVVFNCEKIMISKASQNKTKTDEHEEL